MDSHIDNFLNYLVVERGLSPHTVEGYSRDVRKFADFCDAEKLHDLYKIDSLTIMEFMLALKDRGLSSTTTARNLSALRMFFRFLLREGVLTADPTLNIDSPKLRPHLPSVLSMSEVDALLAQPDVTTPRGMRDKTMMEILYATGVRVSE